MAANRWLATGNYFSSYREEQRIFFTHLDRTVFMVFIALLFLWPYFFKLSNKYMLVIDNILIAMVAILAIEMGFITPPVGLNIYAVKGVAESDVSLGELFVGVMPFFLMMAFCVILFIGFPGLSTWLPGLMKF